MKRRSCRIGVWRMKRVILACFTHTYSTSFKRATFYQDLKEISSYHKITTVFGIKRKEAIYTLGLRGSEWRLHAENILRQILRHCKNDNLGEARGTNIFDQISDF